MSAKLHPKKSSFSQRFRRFLPVIVDIETSGMDPRRHAILEIAAVIPTVDDADRWHVGEIHSTHVIPFAGAEFDPLSLAFNRIDPIHPFRQAIEEREALETIFGPIRLAMERHDCVRAVLVGHNVAFDLRFLNAAVSRAGTPGNPFHAFTSFDTATLSALMFGQTVLAKAARAAGLEWDNASAHSALYDAERTGELFCWMVNRWSDLTKLERRHQTNLPD